MDLFTNIPREARAKNWFELATYILTYRVGVLKLGWLKKKRGEPFKINQRKRFNENLLKFFTIDLLDNDNGKINCTFFDDACVKFADVIQ